MKGKLWWTAENQQELDQWKDLWAGRATLINVEAVDAGQLAVIVELDKACALEILGYVPEEEEWLIEATKPTSSHTPGPWECAGAHVGKTQYGEIAETFGMDFEANARLIAAAPEMLTTLELLQWSKRLKFPSDGEYHQVCPCCEEERWDGHNPACALGNLIKKAKGETP